MKKKLNKKLIFNKEIISRLQNEEMKVSKAGAILTFVTCDCDTASCSIVGPCCDPEKEKNLIDRDLEGGI